MDEKIFTYFSEDNYRFLTFFSVLVHGFSLLNDFPFYLGPCLLCLGVVVLFFFVCLFYKYLVYVISPFTF